MSKIHVGYSQAVSISCVTLNRGKTLKHPFQTDAVASSWLNQSRDHRKSKTRPRNKHQIIRQIRVDDGSEAHVSHRGYHEASVTSYVYET